MCPSARALSSDTVVYRQLTVDCRGVSPSANKPAEFMAWYKVRHFWEFTHRGGRVNPITKEDLYLVHDQAYVDGVFDGTILNGFESRDARVPESCLWTIGSLPSAALHAPQTPLPALSPTSGFHHAGYAWGGGYCTFNGLALTAAKFIEAHPGATVGILDCNFHYGYGTDDILKHKPELASRVVHHTSGKHFHDGDDPDESQTPTARCVVVPSRGYARSITDGFQSTPVGLPIRCVSVVDTACPGVMCIND